MLSMLLTSLRLGNLKNLERKAWTCLKNKARVEESFNMMACTVVLVIFMVSTHGLLSMAGLGRVCTLPKPPKCALLRAAYEVA